MNSSKRAAVVAVWLGVAFAAHSEPQAQVTEALASVYSTDVLSGFMVEYCDAHASARAPAARKSWLAWREHFHVSEVQRQIDSGPSANWRNTIHTKRQEIHKLLAARGTPEQVCTTLATQWEHSSMDMRRLHPAAFDAQGRVVQAIGPAAPKAAPAAEPSVADKYVLGGRPTGVVFSVPQLDGHYAQGSLPERRSRLNSPVYVKGLVERYGDKPADYRYFLVYAHPVYAASMSVSTGLPLQAQVGREVVLQGTLDQLPGSLATLRNARVVSDPSALTEARTPHDYRLFRKNVALARVRAEPGHGVKLHDIRALVFKGEHASLLLKDGSLYYRMGLPPSDLDVKASRELEPQYWHQWKTKLNGDYLVRWSDRDGKPKGDWVALPGFAVKPWPEGHKLSGSFTDHKFYGSIGLGGTYFRESYIFRADGRFESIGFSQSSAGSMAAMNGFSSSATHTRDAKGSQTTVAAQSSDPTVTTGPGAGVPTSTVTGHTKRDDGSGNRGSYRIDGYTMELRFDNGTTSRVLAFPWSKNYIFVGHTSYGSETKTR